MATYQEQLAKIREVKQAEQDFTVAALRNDQGQMTNLRWELEKANGFYRKIQQPVRLSLGDLLRMRLDQK